MQFVTDALAELRQSKIPHVVFSSYQRAVQGVGKQPTKVNILSTDGKTLARILGAEPVDRENVKRHPLYVLRHDDGSDFDVMIYEKGKNLFPERYESEMLGSAVVIDNKFLGLDLDKEFWTALYIQVVHAGLFPPQVRAVYLEKIKERIGLPMQCKYDGIKCYNVVNVNKNEAFEEE